MFNSWFTDKIIETRLSEKGSFLDKVEQFLDWDSLLHLLGKIHQRDFSDAGRKAYPKLVMLKAILLQQWYSLSDVELENCLRDRLSFIKFCGLSLESSVPDHSTISRFRNKLIEKKIHQKLLHEINRQISVKGISIKSGTIVDASLIQSHSHPNRKEIIDVEPIGNEEQKESNEKPILTREESKDPDARWIKKGKKSVYGYKANISVDPKTGLVQNIISTPANIHDVNSITNLISLLDLEKGSPILADKGYCSKSVREFLRGMGLKPQIMFKQYKNDILRDLKIKFNHQVSKIRYVVERTFGNLHSTLNFGKTPYVGLAKTDFFLTMKCVVFNIKKASIIKY